MDMKKTIIKPYKFAFHDRVSNVQPQNQYWDMVINNPKLTREQKDTIFGVLTTNTGKENYKLLGWVFPFGQFMKTFLVKYKYDKGIWYEVKAFDKQCIRNCNYTNTNIVKIIEID